MLDRRIAPPIQPIQIPDLPPYQADVLAAGAPLYLVRQGAQPVFALEVYMPVPRSEQASMLAMQMAARMLQEGTRSYTATQIQDELALAGAFIETGAGEEYLSLSIYGLSRHLERLVPLISELLTQPSFLPERFAQVQRQSIQQLTINLEKTSFLASEAFRAQIFGADQLLGRPTLPADLAALTAEESAALYQQAVGGGALVFLSGQYDSHALAALKAGLPLHALAGQAGLKAPGQHYEPGSRVFAPKAGANQVSLRQGCRLFDRSHPDYLPLRITVEIFGGYFGSRLMKNIREEKGLTYGISARISPLVAEGYLVIGTDVNKDNYELALQEIDHEMRRLHEEPVSDTELELVRNYMLGGYANSLGTPFATADKHKTLMLNALPNDYYQQYLQAIRTTTPAQIQAMAQRYLRPEHMVTIVAGIGSDEGRSE